MEDTYAILVELADQGHDCLLAVVLQADGSTPCKAGAKAIIDADRILAGTIGGGSVEAEAQRRAAATIESGQPVVLDLELEGDAVGDADPICGGAMRVLLDPTTARHRDVYAKAAEIRRRRQRGVLLTTIRNGEPSEVTVECLAEEEIPPRPGFPGVEAVRAALAREQTQLCVSQSTPKGKPVEVLIEPLIAQPVLLILGGGHVGQAVAWQAGLVGFDVAVIDDRPEFTRPELFPNGTTAHCGEIGQEVTGIPLAPDTYVVIVTRGHAHDADALAACIHEPVAYIGMIGSRRKVAMMRRDFIESGRATPEEFDRVYAPIGLDIGSVTVPEIAASIVAQLIAVRRTGSSSRIPNSHLGLP